ncbi:UTRA domain-containing protein [Nostocoides sp. F2B08]|uniref:GntR family transcriptional regulator n=1 Tax=Nostocoides sp. F2B08 TaxID=2653936 RepID=UPI001263C8F2|nr:GntR family transcriptional regulator [Tetrasphaera sp. F2B08]KAB7745492.1 UTRA domain-containing protein [Tetrasphaera sp. F2B08]
MSKTIPVVIDRTSPVPLYHQLAEQLTEAIETGVLQPGDPFENELALAARLDLSRPTVRRAIAELVGRGLLVRRRGVGTTVANQVIHRRDELSSLWEDLVRRGTKPSSEILEIDRERVNPVAAEAMGLAEDTPLLYLKRRRMAGDTPAAILENYLPPHLADLDDSDLRTRGLYDILKARGVRPVIAHQVIGARRPTSEERRLLGLASGDPLLTMTRRAYDSEGAPVEYGDHCYRYDQYAFDVTVYER